jgi:hypothetical protein
MTAALDNGHIRDDVPMPGSAPDDEHLSYSKCFNCGNPANNPVEIKGSIVNLCDACFKAYKLGNNL